MHRIVSRYLRKSPRKVRQFALDNLQRWRSQGVDCADFDTWENLLQQQSEKLNEVLEGDSDEAVRLRQSSPFAGLLTDEERLHVFKTIS